MQGHALHFTLSATVAPFGASPGFAGAAALVALEIFGLVNMAVTVVVQAVADLNGGRQTSGGTICRAPIGATLIDTARKTSALSSGAGAPHPGKSIIDDAIAIIILTIAKIVGTRQDLAFAGAPSSVFVADALTISTNAAPRTFARSIKTASLGAGPAFPGSFFCVLSLQGLQLAQGLGVAIGRAGAADRARQDCMRQ